MESDSTLWGGQASVSVSAYYLCRGVSDLSSPALRCSTRHCASMLSNCSFSRWFSVWTLCFSTSWAFRTTTSCSTSRHLQTGSTGVQTQTPFLFKHNQEMKVFFWFHLKTARPVLQVLLHSFGFVQLALSLLQLLEQRLHLRFHALHLRLCLKCSPTCQ